MNTIDNVSSASLDKFAQVVNYTFGGWHHVRNRKDHNGGKTVSFNIGNGIATYDFNELTKLVLVCHLHSIRAEIQQAGPHQLKIFLSARSPMVEGMKFWERHPTLEHLKEQIESLLASKVATN
jgi:hypothetical protein